MAKPTRAQFDSFKLKADNFCSASNKLSMLTQKINTLAGLVGYESISNAQYDAIYAQYTATYNDIVSKFSALPRP